MKGMIEMRGRSYTDEEKKEISDKLKAYWARQSKAKRKAKAKALAKGKSKNSVKERSERMKLIWAQRKQAQFKLEPSTNITALDNIIKSLAMLVDTPQTLEQAQMVIGSIQMAEKYLRLKFNL